MTSSLVVTARDVCGSDAVTVDDGFSVGGVMASVIVAPATIDQLSALLRRTGPDIAVVATGGRTKVQTGLAPERLDLVISTARLDRMVQHDPGDLVVRVQAGTRLDALQAALAPHGQQLALEALRPEATVGGVVATNETGPRRHRYGSARDVLIGATMVLADGTVARTGGKVVKNVAGYDLAKLMVGSYGTLAVLAEVNFRLHPLAEHRRVVVTPVTIAELPALLVAHRTSTLEPAALELVLEAPGGDAHLVVVFEGPEPSVDAQAALAAGRHPRSQVLDAVPAALDVHPCPERHVGLRVVVEPAATMAALDALARTGMPGRIAGRAAVGIFDANLDPGSLDAPALAVTLDRLRRDVAPFDGSVVVTDLPASLQSGLDVWGPVAAPTLALMRAVKHRFDPDRRLSPGRFVGGI